MDEGRVACGVVEISTPTHPIERFNRNIRLVNDAEKMGFEDASQGRPKNSPFEKDSVFELFYDAGYIRGTKNV